MTAQHSPAWLDDAKYGIIRAWCAPRGLSEPSNGDCMALVAALTAPTRLDYFIEDAEASGDAEKCAAFDERATIGEGWLLDSKGRRLVGTSHHYTAASIKALIWELKTLEDPRMTTQADFENRDWRAWCGTLHRVLSGMASEVPFAPNDTTTLASREEPAAAGDVEAGRDHGRERLHALYYNAQVHLRLPGDSHDRKRWKEQWIGRVLDAASESRTAALKSQSAAAINPDLMGGK